VASAIFNYPGSDNFRLEFGWPGWFIISHLIRNLHGAASASFGAFKKNEWFGECHVHERPGGGGGSQVKNYSPIHMKQNAAEKNTGEACPRGGRVVLMHTVLQQLVGCVG